MISRRTFRFAPSVAGAGPVPARAAGAYAAPRGFEGECAQFRAAALNASRWFKLGSSRFKRGISSRMNTLYEEGSRGFRSRRGSFFGRTAFAAFAPLLGALQKSCAAWRSSASTWSSDGPPPPCAGIAEGGGAYGKNDSTSSDPSGGE